MRLRWGCVVGWRGEARGRKRHYEWVGPGGRQRALWADGRGEGARHGIPIGVRERRGLHTFDVQLGGMRLRRTQQCHCAVRSTPNVGLFHAIAVQCGALIINTKQMAHHSRGCKTRSDVVRPKRTKIVLDLACCERARFGCGKHKKATVRACSCFG